MTPLEDLNSRFVYKNDKFDKWTILTGEGKIEGDCEDYSLTLIWLLSDKSYFKTFFNIIFCKYILFYCTYKGRGHVILFHKGKWIDNISKKWEDSLSEDYKLIYPYLSLIAIFAYLIKRY